MDGQAVIADIVACLRCPHCHLPLGLDGGPPRRGRRSGTARCANRHTFDVARQGYLSLLAPGALVRNADTAAMVTARLAFLAAGHYRFLADALATEAAAALTLAGAGRSTVDGCVLDIGGGTGYHLAAVLDALPDRRGIVLDISRNAARHAVRAHPRADAVVADAWQPLPVAAGAASLVLNVFAPRNGTELRRVLDPRGALLVATPTADHLRELIGPLGLLSVDKDKRTRLAGQFDRHFVRHSSQRHERLLHLSHADVHALVAMGPSARHTDTATLARQVMRLPEPCGVTASFRTVTFLPRVTER